MEESMELRKKVLPIKGKEIEAVTVYEMGADDCSKFLDLMNGAISSRDEGFGELVKLCEAAGIASGLTTEKIRKNFSFRQIRVIIQEAMLLNGFGKGSETESKKAQRRKAKS